MSFCSVCYSPTKTKKTCDKCDKEVYVCNSENCLTHWKGNCPSHRPLPSPRISRKPPKRKSPKKKATKRKSSSCIDAARDDEFREELKDSIKSLRKGSPGPTKKCRYPLTAPTSTPKLVPMDIAQTVTWEVMELEESPDHELREGAMESAIKWFCKETESDSEVIEREIEEFRKIDKYKNERGEPVYNPTPKRTVQSEFFVTLFGKNKEAFGVPQTTVDAFGKSSGGPQAGRKPMDAEEKKFRAVSRKGYRAGQMLTHFSRVCAVAYHSKQAKAKTDIEIDLQHLKDNESIFDKNGKEKTGEDQFKAAVKKKLGEKFPNLVEVQFGYICDLNLGKIKLYASANNALVAKQLALLLNNPCDLVKECFGAEYTIGKKVAPKEGMRAADRISRWTERHDRFLGKVESVEAKDDLIIAGCLWELFRIGELEIVINKGGRHAEQNIARAISLDLGDAYDAHEFLADIQGTRYRCMACTAELGVAHTHKTKPFSGKLLELQAHLKLSAARVIEVQKGDAEIHATFIEDSSESSEDEVLK